jgi:hypothetical protein|tara:strand:- start:1408 stop:1563 length:156 start_codon:yes stop_codon:yes gene_type:complete
MFIGRNEKPKRFQNNKFPKKLKSISRADLSFLKNLKLQTNQRDLWHPTIKG